MLRCLGRFLAGFGFGLWVATLVACGSKDRPACLPVNLEPSALERGAIKDTGPVAVFVDTSGSMVGYLRGTNSTGYTPYKDLIRTLPDLSDLVATSVEYFTFDTTVRNLDRNSFPNAARESFYKNSQRNRWSQINDAFNQAVEKPADTLAVIITDLFLSSAELDLSGWDSLRRPLTNALHKGKHIALVGIMNPFSGRIYDLPSGKPLAYTGERPFYLIMIGPEARIAALYQHMEKEILSNLSADQYHFTLFTPNLVESVVTSGPPQWRIQPGAGIRLTQTVLTHQPSIAQFAVTRPSEPLIITLPLAPLKKPPRLSWGHLELREQLYQYSPRGDSCGWALVDTHTLPPLSKLGAFTLDSATIELFHNQTMTRYFPKTGIFLLTLKVVATRLALPSPALDWVETWSLTSDDEPRLRAEPPPFFRTLYLAKIARIMAEIVSEQYQEETVAAASIAFRIQ